MSKRKKHRKFFLVSKKKKKGKDKKKELASSYVKECHTPKWVKIGPYEVFLCGHNDFGYHEKMCKVEMAKLDVFFGLSDYGWSGKEKKEQGKYSNPILEAIRVKYFGDDSGLNNIMVSTVPDRGVDRYLYFVVREVMKEGEKVGFGCSGGHGRTGWLAAMLIKYFENCSGDEAVRRIRERFCKECVESKTQIEDLDCKKEKGSDKVSTFASDSSWKRDYYPGWPPTFGESSFPISSGGKSDEDILLPSFAKESNLLPQAGKAESKKDDDIFITYGD